MSSNVIKGVRAYINQEDVKTIDSDRSVRFRPLSLISEREYVAQDEQYFPDEAEDEAGVSPDEFLEREKEGFLEEAGKIIDDARKEAEDIRQDALNQAEKLKMEALSKGQEQGYREGMEKAQEEILQIKQELMEKSKEMDLKFEQAKAQMEPEMAKVLIGLVKNLTGVILENEESVILHLVARAMGRITRNDLFIIHVSREDYPVLEKKKAFLEKIAGSDKKVTLIEDEDMVRGQCRIETDDQIIDCGMDTQIGTLCENILLLAKV